MSQQQPPIPNEPAAPVFPWKPALAPGVRSQVLLPNATKPSGPGLDSPATFTPGVKPPLGMPKPRLRAIEPASSAVSSYKVSSPAPTQSEETLPPVHLIAGGLAAFIAITAAVLLFLKF